MLTAAACCSVLFAVWLNYAPSPADWQVFWLSKAAKETHAREGSADGLAFVAY